MGLWFTITRSGPLAQLVEQVTLNHLVVGSSPTRPTRRITRRTENSTGFFSTAASPKYGDLLRQNKKFGLGKYNISHRE